MRRGGVDKELEHGGRAYASRHVDHCELPPSVSTPPFLVFANKSNLLPKPTPSATTSTASVNSTLALLRTQTTLKHELDKHRQAAFSRGGGGSSLGAEGGGEEGAALGGLDVVGGENNESVPFLFSKKWEDGNVGLRVGWVDVRKTAGAGDGGECDSEGEREGEKMDLRPSGTVVDGDSCSLSIELLHCGERRTFCKSM